MNKGIFPIEVGKELVLVPYGNFARNWYSVRTCPVEKIGRKYFYVYGFPFDIQTGQFVDNHDYNGGFTLYPSMEAYEDDVKTQKMADEIRKAFSAMNARRDIPNGTIQDIYRLLTDCGAVRTDDKADTE